MISPVSRPATKVLLVDDDEIVLNYLRLLVGSEGYSVVTATSAEAALVSMQLDFAQIVIVDIGLPGMDGQALCRAIRRQTYSGYVYLMLHTAKATGEDIRNGFDAGADDYLRKGTPRGQIIARLRVAQRILSHEHSLLNSRERNEQIALSIAPAAAQN
jgi:sigma-B regulation protein RsbU (phosphoserine phosphatase)